jgi:hypothetical protein
MMLRRIIVLTLTCSLLFSISCSCLLPSPMPYGPKVTGDGTGGAIAVYEDIKGRNQHDFYAQKISTEGEALWGEKGVLIGGGYREADSFFDLHIVSDGSGEAIIAWVARPSSQHPIYISHVTSVDSGGKVRWQEEVKTVTQMISDGAGGAIIATDYEETSFIKIDSEGNFTWGKDGVSIHHKDYGSNSLQLASDGAGGAIIVCEEITNRIFAQKIDAEGNLSWGQEGVLLYTTPEGVYAEEPKVVSDGLGGAIAIWVQEPEGIIEESSPEAVLNDMYAQRVDDSGNILWQPNGVPLGITRGGGGCPSNALLVSDGASGAIVIWEDLRKGLMSLYAQKIDADGNIKWQPGGEEVCYIKTNTSFWPRMAVSDGSGGTIVTYSNRAQRIDADGSTIWADDGILFTKRGTHDLDYDGHGGAIIAWGSGKSMFRSERAHVQRIDSSGNLLWGEGGIRLNP